MSIEKDIKNLTNAFGAFVEVRIKEEVDARIELEGIPYDKKWDTDSEVREKYKKVLEYL